MCRALVLLAALLPMLIVASDVAAKSKSLRAAKRAYKNFEYDRVLPLLEKARGETDDPTELVKIHELEATVHLSQGRPADAEKAFVSLLRAEPDFELAKKASPKLREAFAAAKQQVASEPAPPRPAPTSIDAAPATVVTPTDGPTDLKVTSEPSAFYEEWWFWTVVGAVAVAGAGGSYLVWRTTLPSDPETKFGPFPLGY